MQQKSAEAAANEKFRFDGLKTRRIVILACALAIITLSTIIITVIVSKRPPGSSKEWDYNDVQKWIEDFPACGGDRQSPIDLKNSKVEPAYDTVPIEMHGYHVLPDRMKIQNTGHTVQLSATYKHETPYISGGPLKGNYQFVQLHFHWGPSNDIGSEHAFSGMRAPLEMHVVHFQTDHGTLKDAQGKDAGLSVMALLGKINGSTNHGLRKLRNSLLSVKEPYSTAEIESFPLSELFHVNNDNSTSSHNFFTYNGSLTTPPCSETVVWLVRNQPLSVSTKTMGKFRKISLEHGGDSNYRPVQPLNGRTVYYF